MTLEWINTYNIKTRNVKLPTGREVIKTEVLLRL